MAFDPTLESVSTHAVPDWFRDAKLGIFVHWGPYSVPGWAANERFFNVIIGANSTRDPSHPFWDELRAEGRRRGTRLTPGEMAPLAEKHGMDEYAWALARCEELGGWEAMNTHRSYAEWYQHTISFPGSPAARWHEQHYGARPYEAFGQDFAQLTADWDPAPWAELFEAAGARYAVLVTKHHDGYALWPSDVRNPNRDGWCSPRDLVADLASAVRAAGLRFGTYYSGGIDWTFGPAGGTPDDGTPPAEQYAPYADAQFRELIDRVDTDVLWNDIAWPGPALQLFADYYNARPDGLVNDRFRPRDGHTYGQATHWDFRTPEYGRFRQAPDYMWEACCAVGNSFGYNRNETEADMLTTEQLVAMFADVVSKGGNLLIDVGPTGDGTIPNMQAAPLRGLGDWLRTNGEAIYGTRPWTRAETTTDGGLPVRFTQRGDAVYAIILGTPPPGPVVLKDVDGVAGRADVLAQLIGGNPILARPTPGGLVLDVPALPDAPAHAIRLGV